MCEEISNDRCNFRRPVTSERSAHPALREEYVAGTLNLGQQIEAGANEPPRICLSQRVIEIMHVMTDLFGHK